MLDFIPPGPRDKAGVRVRTEVLAIGAKQAGKKKKLFVFLFRSTSTTLQQCRKRDDLTFSLDLMP